MGVLLAIREHEVVILMRVAFTVVGREVHRILVMSVINLRSLFVFVMIIAVD